MGAIAVFKKEMRSYFASPIAYAVFTLFLIISGAPETEKKTDFGLWEWSGNATEQPRRLTKLEEDVKPEGITGASINGQNFVIVVGDAGKYLKLEYK